MPAERASVSANSLRHILAFSGYDPGTIAGNVTWMERGFNAGQPFTSYWSEVATFSYPLAFNTSVGGVPIEIPGKSLVLRKLESWGYQVVKTV